MATSPRSPLALSLTAALGLAACGGGGGTTGGAPAAPVSTTAPTTAPTVAPVTASTQQVVTMALPTSAIGTVVDPTFGPLGGYTQAQFSQALAFAPGSQIMVRNGQTTLPHTLNVVSTTGFPASANLSLSAAGGGTLAAGFASGNVAPGALVGPITLTAGTYYVGCAYHYAQGMRGVIVVAANATPGPQATAIPNATPVPQATSPGTPPIYGY